MAEGTIDCKITYPATDADDVNLTDIDNFAIVEEGDIQQKRPVIILLGWMGCLDKHLAKYSEIYERRRFITVRYTAPTHTFFISQGKLKAISQKLLDMLFEHSLEQHPLLFHIFSNGGCFVYSNITQLIHSSEKYKKLQVKGCIFDSAPGKRRIFKAVQAFMNSLRVNTVLKYLLGFCLGVLMCVMGFLAKLLSRSQATMAFFLFEDIQNDKGMWPEMFLYSSKDTTILHEDVEELIEHRKELGVIVQAVRWDDSSHVSHFRLHPEVYTQKCDDFADMCFKGDAPA